MLSKYIVYEELDQIHENDLFQMIYISQIRYEGRVFALVRAARVPQHENSQQYPYTDVK